MKVTVKVGTGLERKITVEVEAPEVKKKLDAIAIDMAKNVQIPGGYRKLKAKVARIKQMYRQRIAGQAANDLLEETLREAVDGCDFRTVGMPRVTDFGEVAQGKPFAYTMAVEIYPEIPAPRYKGFTIPEKSVEVENEDVDKALVALQEETSQMVEFEGDELVEGLFLTLGITAATDDEEKLKKLTNDSASAVLSSKDLADSLYHALIGQAVGATVSFEAKAADLPLYSAFDLKDETFQWEVTIKEAKEKIVPEADDDFAMQSRGLKSILALRGQLREELTKAMQEEADKARHMAVSQQLLDKNRFPLPMRTIDGMLDEKVKAYEEMVGGYREQFGDDVVRNMIAHHRQEQLSSTASETALYFLLEAIAADAGIEISDEDVEAKIAVMAEEEGVQPSFMKAKLGEDKLENLKFDMRRERVYDLAISLGVRKPYEVFLRELRVERSKSLMRRRHRPRIRRQLARNLRRRTAAGA